MNKVLLFSVLFIFNSKAHKLPAPVQKIVTDALALEANSERGRDIYNNKCSFCHGVDGVPVNVSTSQFPYLAGQTPKYLLIQMAMFKTEHRKNSVMNQISKGLSTQDMTDIKSFLVDEEATSAHCETEQVRLSDSIEAGRILAAKKREFSRADGSKVEISCTMCHGDNGLMPDQSREHTMHPDLAGLGKSYLLKQFKDFKAKRRVNAGPMNLMVRDLSTEDLKNLSAYYSSLGRCN
jgi:cytochrome c553